MDEAEELKAALERKRPGLKCFLCGGNPNSANLGILIPTALANSKMVRVEPPSPPMCMHCPI